MSSTMIIGPVCPKCGATLPARTPRGLCSKCVFAAMMRGDEAAPPAAPARRIGDFEILDTIARGGMGIVYRARQISLNRIVALKLMAEGAGLGPDFVERFRREAEAAASLNHAGIVAVYDFGVHEEQSFLAMEFIDGGVLGRGPQGEKLGAFPPAEAARIVMLVARAVHHAHQRGILHRDIKPGNILLDAQGEPHLADFGLAKLMQRDSAITRTSAVMGTPSFMAPEQAAGKAREITTAADVYGLGAVLYNLLTGAPPFAGGTTLETIRQVMDQEPKRPALLNPAVDRDLETICLKCLQKIPAQRYGSAEALADDLERWRKGEPILARPVTTLERTRKWVGRHRALAALLVTASIALVAVAVVSTVMNVRLTKARGIITAQGEARRRELVALHVTTGNRLAEEGDPFAALESFAEAARLEAVNPERLALHRFRFEVTQAHAPQLAHTFSATGTVTSASFSPDGQRILTAGAEGTNGRARVWDAFTGTPITSLHVPSGPVRWAGFTPDGAHLITRAEKGAVQLWRADTGAAAGGPWQVPPPMLGNRLLTARDGLVWALAVQGTGRWLALPGRNEVVLQPLAADDPVRPVFSTSKSVNQVFFSPDDSQVVALLEGGGAEIHDPATGQLVLVIAAGSNFRNGAWSPDGTQLALANDFFEARLYDARTGALLAPPLAHEAMVTGAQFSPDHRVLATWSFDNCARLFYADTGRPLAPPLRHLGPVRAASLSANGLWLATASADGHVRWWDAKTGETHGARLPHAGGALDVKFSPDGQNLLTASAPGGARLWKISSENFARWTWPQNQPVDQARFSPDGQRVAVACVNEIVRVFDAESGALIGLPLLHPTRGVKAGWLDDRRLATFDALSTLRIWDTTTGQLLSTNAIPPATGDFHGRYFLATRPDRAPELWDTATGQRRFTLAAAPNERLTLRADLRHFLTVRGREVRVQEVETGAAVHPLLRLDHSGVTAALSADSQRVAVAYSDNTVSIWNPATGQRVAGPLRHVASVRFIVFTPDRRILATASNDRTLRLWDAATGEPLGPPLRHPSYVLHISVRADGRAFATACSDGSARLWAVPASAPTVADMARTAHRLSGHAE